MNVLALVRAEFPVDDRRIYLMGHSQGGGGARHLAEKYPDIWAAVALLAPALFSVEPDADSKILSLPVLISVGDQDSLMTSARTFSEQLKALNADARVPRVRRPRSRHDHHREPAGGLPVLRWTRQAREREAMNRIDGNLRGHDEVVAGRALHHDLTNGAVRGASARHRYGVVRAGAGAGPRRLPLARRPIPPPRRGSHPSSSSS